MNSILNKNFIKIINSYNKCALNVCNHSIVRSDQRLSRLRPQSGVCQSIIPVRLAGHSKWQNIKHTKLSKDAEKSQTINRMLNKLKISLRNVGGTDPKINREFGDVMEQCRRANIPNTTIDKAIKRFLDKKVQPMKLEVMGPNGCLLVLDAESETKNSLRYVVKTVLKKYNGFAFLEDGRAMHAFQEKAVVRVRDRDRNGVQVDLEKAEEIAIEADAEEVKHCSEDESVVLFITEVQNCSKTRKYIEDNTEYEVIESGLELIPYTRIELPEESLQLVFNAIEELENLEVINRIYNNIN